MDLPVVTIDGILLRDPVIRVAIRLGIDPWGDKQILNRQAQSLGKRARYRGTDRGSGTRSFKPPVRCAHGAGIWGSRKWGTLGGHRGAKKQRWYKLPR